MSSAFSRYRSANVLTQPALDELVDQHVAEPLDVHLAAAAEVADRSFIRPGHSVVRAEDVDAGVEHLDLLPARRARRPAASRASPSCARRTRRTPCSRSGTPPAPRAAPRARAVVAHSGHFFGASTGFAPFGRLSFWTSTTYGITSPERSTTIVSPRCRSSRWIWSMLCSVTFETVTPLMNTGSSLPTGVSCARSADLPLDVLQHRRLLLGLVLVGDDPPRRLARRAEPVALREVVDLHHHAVGHVRQLRALLLELVDALDRLVDVRRRATLPSAAAGPTCAGAASTPSSSSPASARPARGRARGSAGGAWRRSSDRAAAACRP